MRDFKTIIEELKLYLGDTKEMKILDKDVAEALEISQSRFATIKKRNTIPYESLLIYCKKEDICPIELFFA